MKNDNTINKENINFHFNQTDSFLFYIFIHFYMNKRFNERMNKGNNIRGIKERVKKWKKQTWKEEKNERDY